MKAVPVALAAIMLSGTAPVQRTDVQLQVNGLRSAKGLVQACLTADPRTFPDCARDPDALHVTAPARSGETLVFRSVMPGNYAIALFHDENANGRMDKMLMMPREGFGFSRDAAVRFGPPKFAAAVIAVSGPEMRTTVRVRYLL